jgi:hypothetical protein
MESKSEGWLCESDSKLDLRIEYVRVADTNRLCILSRKGLVATIDMIMIYRFVQWVITTENISQSLASHVAHSHRSRRDNLQWQEGSFPSASPSRLTTFRTTSSSLLGCNISPTRLY